MPHYYPADHYWIVAGDDTRRWSSARSTWVPADDATYLDWAAQPERWTTPIASEADLTDVLRAAGLPGPAPTVDDVRAEAGRRIEAIMPLWTVAREVSGGTPIASETRAAAQHIRDRSDEIEAMEPIPADYCNDTYWIIAP